MSAAEEIPEWQEGPLLIDESKELCDLPYMSDTLWLTNDQNGSINHKSVERTVRTFFQMGGTRLVVGPTSRIDSLFFDLAKCKTLAIANRYLLDLSELTRAKSLWWLKIEGEVCRDIRCLPKLSVTMLDIRFSKRKFAEAYCETLRTVRIARANFQAFPLDTFSSLAGFSTDILRIDSARCVDALGLAGRAIQLYGCRKLERITQLSCFDLDFDGCLKLDPEHLSAVKNLNTLRFRSYAKAPQSWNWLAKNKTLRLLTLMGKANTLEVVKLPKLELLEMQDTGIKKESAQKLSQLNPYVLMAHGRNYFLKGDTISSEEFQERKKRIEAGINKGR